MVEKTVKSLIRVLDLGNALWGAIGTSRIENNRESLQALTWCMARVLTEDRSDEDRPALIEDAKAMFGRMIEEVSKPVLS
jgi:hypothetical protein